MLNTAIFMFLARIVDVSLNTLKFKAMLRGNKPLTSLIAFFEVTIYMLAAAQAFKYIDNTEVLIGFALGYASGSYVGMVIDDLMSNDKVFLTLITDHDGWSLADTLRQKGFGVTTTKAYGLGGSEKAQLTVILERKRLKELHDTINKVDKNTYIVTMTVKDVARMSAVRK